eukprot:3809953-Rhodomonas_salina.1
MATTRRPTSVTGPPQTQSTEYYVSICTLSQKNVLRLAPALTLMLKRNEEKNYGGSVLTIKCEKIQRSERLQRATQQTKRERVWIE